MVADCCLVKMSGNIFQMRLFRILLLITFLNVFYGNRAISQNVKTGPRITLKIKNRPLNLVLKDISDQSGTPISYSNQQLPLDKKISVNIKKATIEQALTEVLKPLDLQYVFVENQVIVKPVPAKMDSPLPPVRNESMSYTIKGYVKDKKNGESVVGATVYTADTKYGTISNNYGFFSLTLPADKYSIVVSFVGYKPQKYDVALNGNFTLNIALEEEEMLLAPVIITNTTDSNRFVQNNRMGFTEMASAKVSRMPLFFAEPDVIKAMQYMPGVKNTIDGSGNYYVRGGERDQNLILLDDAPVYNPSHLFGFFTCINPEAVTDIKLYKSDFPAYVGGKLASVLEVKTKEGNINRFSMAGELGLITSRLSAEGPMFKKKSSFFISYRQSHIEKLIQRANTNVSDFQFSDLNAKFNFCINDKNRLLFSFYSGRDDFFAKKWNGDKQGINWGNNLASLRWNRTYGLKLFSNTTMYLSNYNYNFFTAYNSKTRWHSGIATLGLKNDFIYFQKPELTHYFGVNFNSCQIKPGMILSNNYISPEYVPQIDEMKTGDSHLYYSANLVLNKKLTLRYGLRTSLFSNKGPARWYALNDTYEITDTLTENGKGAYNRYFRLEPSFTCTYLLDNKNSLKFNYFRAHQFFQILSNSISPFTSIEVWHPSTPVVKPQSSDQFSMGYFTNIFNNTLNLSVEFFYKYMQHQFDYNNQSNLLLNPYIEKELRFGNTHAYGTEITLKKEIGKWQGNVGYAYCRALRKTNGVNNNETYPAYSDRPYDFSLYVQYQPNHKWLLTSGVIYAAGMPYSAPTGYYNYMGYKVPVYSRKNNARMPDYFRWDVSFQRTLNKPGNRWEHYLTFSVFNITNHKNPVFINFNKMVDENGNFTIPSNYAYDNSLSTSQIILIGIIPSIKYNFKF